MIDRDGLRRRVLLGLPLLAAAGGLAYAARVRPGPAVSVQADPGDGTEEPPPVVGTEPAPDATPTDPVALTFDYVAATIGFARGVGVDEVIRLVAGEEAPRFASDEAAVAWIDADPDYGRVFGYAYAVDDWTFLWEDNGFRGSDPGVAARLSRRGEFASLFWNVNLDMAFTYARAGKVVRQFDPFAVEQGQGAPLRQEKGLDLTDAGMPASGLELLSRITGLPVVDLSWRDRPERVIFGELL